jgi:hypothetical protein
MQMNNRTVPCGYNRNIFRNFGSFISVCRNNNKVFRNFNSDQLLEPIEFFFRNFSFTYVCRSDSKVFQNTSVCRNNSKVFRNFRSEQIYDQPTASTNIKVITRTTVTTIDIRLITTETNARYSPSCFLPSL